MPLASRPRFPNARKQGIRMESGRFLNTVSRELIARLTGNWPGEAVRRSRASAARLPSFTARAFGSSRLSKNGSTTERLNALNDRYKLDRRSRNAAYGLIYLTLTNICEHAVVRFLEARDAVKSMHTLLAQTLTMIMLS